MTVMRARFGKAYGVELDPPPAFSLAQRRQELDDLESAFRQQFGSRVYQWTRTRRTIIQQFFETVASELRKTFDHANRDAGNWLRALMAPLENQVREVQRQLKHRLENVRRIHEAADSLEDSIEEIEHARAQLDTQLGELEKLATGLEATLHSVPTEQPLRVAA
jgi:DNA repair exonuclease SbcCD ATPase subunit